MQNKKMKILIVSHAMELGGAEMALLGLLEHLDTDRVDVDLFLLRHTGEGSRRRSGSSRKILPIPAWQCRSLSV